MQTCTEPAGFRSDWGESALHGRSAQSSNTPAAIVRFHQRQSFTKRHISIPPNVFLFIRTRISLWSSLSSLLTRCSKSPHRPESECFTLNTNFCFYIWLLQHWTFPYCGTSKCFLILNHCFLSLVLLEAENTGICILSSATWATRHNTDIT